MHVACMFSMYYVTYIYDTTIVLNNILSIFKLGSVCSAGKYFDFLAVSPSLCMWHACSPCIMLHTFMTLLLF